jgi:CheY-like chemotaxis protein
MRLARRFERRKHRMADPYNNGVGQDHIKPSNQRDAIEQPQDNPPGVSSGEKSAVVDLNLSDSLMRFAGDRDSSEQPETESDIAARFDIIDDPCHPCGIVSAEARDAILSSVEDERRMHPREDSSDLVWLEYYDSSNECTAKEAARVENVGAGGMRVAIKSVSPDLERVIVSYPYRGFESRSIVRSRYQSEDGQEHLCLEFADREWTVSRTGAAVADGADQITSGRILLADDDAAFRKILGNILNKAGYDVVLAEDGQIAVTKAASENPDLIMTDGLMPKLHGFQVCKAVKELNPQAKVIMLTAVYTSPNYLWEAKTKFGADDVITKPFEIADLLSKIEKHMPSHCRRVA